MKKQKIAICAIFKNEAKYLYEWISFHQLMGIGHFFLYNNNSTDDFIEVIRLFDESTITLIDWPRQPGQISAYNHCLYRFGDQCDWLAFIDIDEFLYCPDSTPLPDFMDRYKNYGGLGINWMVFGSSGHKTKPDGDVTRNYLMRGKKDITIPYSHLAIRTPGNNSIVRYIPFNSHIKSVVQPQAVDFCPNPHYFIYRRGFFCVSESGERIDGPFSKTVGATTIRLNHYWSKSTEECVEKIAKGKADSGEYRVWQEFELRERFLNECEDRSILDAIDLMRKKHEVD